MQAWQPSPSRGTSSRAGLAFHTFKSDLRKSKSKHLHGCHWHCQWQFQELWSTFVYAVYIMLQHRACSLTSSKPSTSACFIRPSPRAVQVSLGNLTPKIVIVQKNCWQIRCSVPGGGDETPSTSSTGLDTPAPAQTPVPLNPTWVSEVAPSKLIRIQKIINS